MAEERVRKLRTVREQRNLSLRELAEELKVHYSLISYWERGLKTPRAGNKVKLSKALGKPADELLEYIDED